MYAASVQMVIMGGFRNPTTSGSTRLLRFNRQGPREVTSGNTGDVQHAHDQKRVSLCGEARLYSGCPNNTSDWMNSRVSVVGRAGIEPATT